MKKVLILMVIFPFVLLSASWKYTSDKNEITGEESFYAISPYTKATKKMDFPYSNTETWIGIGCKNGVQWAYFGFTIPPNLVDTTIKSNYNWVISTFKVGNNVAALKLIQKWGSKFLFVTNDIFIDTNSFISMIKKGNYLILELKWYGNGTKYFKYSLKNSEKIINKMQKMCEYKGY